MRHFDLSSLSRSSIGFDRMARLLDQACACQPRDAYPPYNIEKSGADAYRLSVAVAGFAEDELSVELRDGQLIVSGRKAEAEASPAQAAGNSTDGPATHTLDTAAPRTSAREFLHRGIATRAFERRFQLADHVRVVEATTEHGLLHIDLVREIPEAMKRRRIAIGRTAGEQTGVEQVAGEKTSSDPAEPAAIGEVHAA